jgi:hypothetical protein
MMLACAAWTLLILPPAVVPLARVQAASAQPSAGGSTGPAAAASPKDERADQAATYYSRGRYVEAALEFEGLWRDFPGEPRFLFNAAASRYAAGHYAHTVAYLGEYLARAEIVGEDRKEAQAQLDEARNKVTSVQVVVTMPAGASGAVKVVAQHVARGASDLRPELVVPTTSHADGTMAVVQLEPGSNWVVHAEGDGLISEAQQVQVTRAAGQQVALQLEATSEATTVPVAGPPAQGEGLPATTVRAMTLGFAVGGGAAAAVGVAVLAVGASKRGRLADCDTAARGELACKQDLALALRTRDAGAAVLGAGVGLLAGGLTWIAGDPRKRRIAWLAEASVGGLALIGGAAWLTVSSNRFNAANTTAIVDWNTHYAAVGGSRGHAAAAGVFGLGAGLVGSAVTGLLVQRRRGGSAMARALRVDGMLGAGRGGLVLSGRF